MKNLDYDCCKSILQMNKFWHTKIIARFSRENIIEQFPIDYKDQLIDLNFSEKFISKIYQNYASFATVFISSATSLVKISTGSRFSSFPSFNKNG